MFVNCRAIGILDCRCPLFGSGIKRFHGFAILKWYGVLKAALNLESHMAKSLIIVESPTKAKTITKYLGRGYTVMASVGHIKDLPTSKLGVDLENNFKPQYVTIKGKSKVLADIKKKAEEADKIFSGS